MNRSGQSRRAEAQLRAMGHQVSRRSLLRFAGLGAAVLGSSTVLSACGAASGAQNAASAVKFTVASVPGDSFILDAINVANSDYAKHQLNVPKHINPSSGVQGFQLLVSNAIDGMGADTLNLMATHVNGQEGQRPVMVGLRVMETTYGIVGSAKGAWPSDQAGFKEKMQSLKGKRVGVTAIGAGGDLQLKLALEEAGMKYLDVTVLAVGLAVQAIPNLKADRIDAYVGVQWTSTRYVAQESGGRVLVDFSAKDTPAIVRDQAVVAIAVREDMAKNHPEVVQRWLAAQQDAHQFMLDEPAKAAKILNDTGRGGKGLAIAEAYMQHYADQVAPSLQPNFKVPQDMVERMAQVGQRFGSIKQGSINYETLVPDFARA